MEAIFIFLLKSSGLIAVFYLAYHFLMRKETFFNSNRWFLLSGLITSLLLPFFTITKKVLVDRPKYTAEDLALYAQQAVVDTAQNSAVAEAFDWLQFLCISYIAIVCVLAVRIVFSFTSLYRMLYKQQVIKKETFKLVNLNQNIAPFSFFNYIVYNADLYSNEELQSILLHEKIHSKEKHSIDVLIAKIFCVIFWFNPFVWLYRKAITQNLEYIADQKAIEQLEDRKSYQRALLKVVSHQSCLSITNNFYQSLIKKRIVMLNTNQSHKRNSWKYALVIPALIAFIFLFQVNVIAQQREESATVKRMHSGDNIRIVVDKNSSDKEMKKDAENLKKDHGITLKYSKVKRNSSGEIIGIKVEFKDKDGNKGVSQVSGNEPIKPIHFYKNDSGIGFGKPKNVQVFARHGGAHADVAPIAINIDDSLDVVADMNFDFDFDFEMPDVPEAPEVPSAPAHFTWSNGNNNTNVIIKRDGDKKPTVIVNGKILSDDKEIEEALKKYGGKSISISSSSDGEDKEIIINGQNLMKIKSEAIANARAQVKNMRPMIKKQVELAKASAQRGRARADMERSRGMSEISRSEAEAIKAEMQAAKEEMIKAKAEMEAAKAAYEKAKAELKK